MVEEEDIEAFREGLKDKTASDLKRIVASLRSELETAKTKEEEALNVYEEAKRQRRIIEMKIEAVRQRWIELLV